LSGHARDPASCLPEPPMDACGGSARRGNRRTALSTCRCGSSA
jgi:hypothetical protein